MAIGNRCDWGSCVHGRNLLVSHFRASWIEIIANSGYRFSWTGFTASIHWMAPTAAGVLIGFGILCIFLPCFNYLVDSFLPV